MKPAINKDPVRFDQALQRIYTAVGARTQMDLSRVLDIRQSSISDAKRRSAIPSDWLLKLYRAYGLDPDWVLEGTGAPYLREDRSPLPSLLALRDAEGIRNGRSRCVPYSGVGGKDRSAPEWSEDPVGVVAVPLPFCEEGQPLVIRMEGQSMEPFIKNGAFLGLTSERGRYGEGDVCAVHIPHHGLMIRRVYVQGAGFRLEAANAQFDDVVIPGPEMASRMLGRVVWIMQQL